MPTPWDLGKRVDDFLFTQKKEFASASGKQLVRVSQNLKKGGEKLSGKRLRNGAQVCYRTVDHIEFVASISHIWCLTWCTTKCIFVSNSK